MTPMQEQYNRIKQDHPDEIVLFRLGDFYETFNVDAQTVSKVLGLTLTGRGKDENRMPMAGIPHHALNNYLPRLLKAGYKAVIVDQLTEPKPGELVERGISKIYTPGTITGDNMIEDNQNNYLASVVVQDIGKQRIFAVALADISTGKLQVFETADFKLLSSELVRLAPSELIIPANSSNLLKLTARDTVITTRPDADFEQQSAYKLALAQFGTLNLKGFGIEEMHTAVSALGGLIAYLQDCQKTELRHLKTVSIYAVSDHMRLDEATIRNLELIWPSRGTDTSSTVYSVINQCQTNMGKRKLRDWLMHPFVIAEPLQARWDAVEDLTTDSMFNSKLRDQLSNIADIERIVSKIGVGSANARDLVGLQTSLETVSSLIQILGGHIGDFSERLQHIQRTLTDSALVQEIIQLISKSIEPEPPITITEGGIIRGGYNAEVDELRALRRGGKETLAGIQTREVERTGISSLKVSYNQVFGYYIEVTRTNSHKVPEDYIRKQTLSNAERYITPELKEWESKILNAEEKLIQLEYKLFVDIRDKLAAYASELLYLADVVAELDVLADFAYVATQYKYAKPKLIFSSDPQLHIKGGRHPVLERLQDAFTPNDVTFNSDSQIILLTGPNMSGKSTYIRQIALIVLLAQTGCFVPAASCEFTIADRIFTRVGASDNLSRGESTFMVEMNETANILNNSTENSLIILDEVGRGTSTYDGVAIAWSIVEYIQKQIRARTLFATHYHELISLASEFPEIKNYHVEVTESGDTILFTHRISPGSTSRSYGVHVAEMAGVPEAVVARANDILAGFESHSSKNAESAKQKSAPARPKKVHPGQLGLL